MEPTDKSIPPATMTGVNATARRPSSTLNLVISKKFPRVKKLGAIAEKKSISPPTTSSSTHSPFGNHRRRHDIALNDDIERRARKALRKERASNHLTKLRSQPTAYPEVTKARRTRRTRRTRKIRARDSPR